MDHRAVQKQQEDAAKLIEAAKGKPPVESVVDTGVKPVVEPAVPVIEVETADLGKPALDLVGAPEGAKDHKFDVLKGKYDKEVIKVREKNKELEVSIANLAAEITALKIAQPGKTIEGQQFSGTASEAMAKIQEDYGPEFLEAITGAAKETVRQELQGVRGEIDSIAEDHIHTKTDKFVEALKRLVPDYVKINKLPEFAAWVEGVDDLTGVSFRALAADANSKLDAPRLAAVFNKFKADNPKLFEGKIDPLETLVEPDGSGGGGANDSILNAEKPTVTRAFMTQFAKDVAIGKYRGREEEQAKIKARIDQAIVDKRIT